MLDEIIEWFSAGGTPTASLSAAVKEQGTKRFCSAPFGSPRTALTESKASPGHMFQMLPMGAIFANQLTLPSSNFTQILRWHRENDMAALQRDG
jgi:hypothetical protein